jgi:hypothetical protein
MYSILTDEHKELINKKIKKAINDLDFTDIVESDRAKAIVDGFSSRIAVEELCRKCGFRKRFDLK